MLSTSTPSAAVLNHASPCPNVWQQLDQQQQQHIELAMMPPPTCPQLPLLLPKPHPPAHTASGYRAVLLSRLLQPRRHQAGCSGQRPRLPADAVGLGCRRHPAALQGLQPGGLWLGVLPSHAGPPGQLWHWAHQVLEDGLHLHRTQAAGGALRLGFGAAVL